MNKNQLNELINYIVAQGVSAIQSNIPWTDASIDYVAIFSKNDDEFNQLEKIAETLWKEIDKENIKTGRTFLLNEAFHTSAGDLSLLKIRKPDPTRPQRGAPDFKVQEYQKIKDTYLQSSWNLTLMMRKEYEMVEIKWVDVLVYLPSQTLSERIL